jgi:GTPase
MATDAQVKDGRPSPISDTVTDVSGTGSFKDGSGSTRSFSFRCSYDIRQGRTTDVTIFAGG